MDIAKQLEILGLEETKRQVSAFTSSPREREKLLRRVDATHEIMSELPEADDLSFLHSGLCQTCLPHSKPTHNHTVWRRTSGRFTLAITPGTISRVGAEGQDGYVGVPYGTKARLILIHLQTEGQKSREVNLGPSLSAFMRSLGLSVTGGKNGSIASTKEQVLRIARCNFSLQWSDINVGGTRTHISDHRIVDGLELWEAGMGDYAWNGSVQLSERFHEDLRKHSVPLDKGAIAELKGNSLALDLYTLFAYRLPQLRDSLHLRWRTLQSQVGSEETDMFGLSRRVRAVLPEVLTVYPHARVEVTPTGLTLRKSEPAVPTRAVRGWRMIEGSNA